MDAGFNSILDRCTAGSDANPKMAAELRQALKRKKVGFSEEEETTSSPPNKKGFYITNIGLGELPNAEEETEDACDFGLGEDEESFFASVQNIENSRLYNIPAHVLLDLINEMPDFDVLRFTEVCTKFSDLALMVMKARKEEGGYQSGPILSHDQREVVDAVVNKRKSVFYTGAAGTGKSEVLKAIVKQLNIKGHRYEVVAPSGIASNNVGGQTIHRFFGISKEVEDDRYLLFQRYLNTPILAERMKSLEFLLIDEISMLKPQLLANIAYAVGQIRIAQTNYKHRPFGGVVVVLCGDFAQLPPIVRREEKKKGNNVVKKDPKQEKFIEKAKKRALGYGGYSGETLPYATELDPRYCFEHPIWNHIVEDEHLLTQPFRQRSDEAWRIMLDEFRMGEVLESSLSLLRDRKIDVNSLSREEKESTTCLYARREDVKGHNDAMMESLNGRSYDFNSADTGDTQRHASEIPVENTLKLKKGARVVLKSNISVENGFYNGSFGTVVGFKRVIVDPEDLNNARKGGSNCVITSNAGSIPIDAPHFLPVVVFDRVPEVKFTVRYWRFEVHEKDVKKNIKKVVASRLQLPLLVAWAITIHGSQSMTLDRAIIKIDDLFDDGQAYVALSRVKTRKGVYINGKVERKSFKTCPRVIRFYNELDKKAEVKRNNRRFPG